MSKKLKKLALLLTSVMLITVFLPLSALAQGLIDTDQKCTLTIDYKDKENGGKPIPNARFSLYKIADVDSSACMKLTSQFEPYKNNISGLSHLDDLTDEEWLQLASTVRSNAVLKDSLSFVAEGKTDGNGVLVFSDLPVGLYLIIGNRATTGDFYTYTSVPFMAFLPDPDNNNNAWVYEMAVEPKFTKEYFPPEEEDDYITRKVLKKWNDEGYETVRPDSIAVQLFCDGAVYEEIELNEGNNWRYAWDNLEANHEWLLAEDVPEDYSVTVTQEGITFIVENKFIVPITEKDPPVQKKIIGDTPKTAETFTFVMTAKDKNFPMPEGSANGQKELTITGAGSKDFGEITFVRAGTYIYTVSEKKGSAEGYTYDENIYTLTYDVELKDGDLVVTLDVQDSAGKPSTVMEFTNKYKEKELPQTGLLWWPVPVLALIGVILIMIGLIQRKSYKR